MSASLGLWRLQVADNHWILPFECVRISREQHVPDSIDCTQNQTSRVGVGCGAKSVERAAHSPSSHTLSKEKNAFADTALAESP